MTHRRFFYLHPHVMRYFHLKMFEKADQLHQLENEIITMLIEADEKRSYVSLGYKSLKGYCISALKFTPTQSQRLVTKVRRHVPMAKIGDGRHVAYLESKRRY